MLIQEDRVQAKAPLAWDGTQMIAAFRAAEQWLKQHVASINRLNVFPVPDGDTGTNMHMTLLAALATAAPAASCALVSDQVYRGALMGARGNSGVILSQILHGVAQGLKEHDICGPVELAQALMHASASAYRSTSNPREGTILTVIRETSEAAQQALKQKGADLISVLTAAVEAARAAVERTPSLLQVLQDAGVVDAGGQGLYIILEGMLRWARGESLHHLADGAATHDAFALFQDVHGEDDFGYCTNLLLKGQALPVDGIRHHMDEHYHSVVVVGDEALMRIHVHTLRPGDVLNYLMQYGDLLTVEIANMDEQRAELQRSRSLPAPDAAPLAEEAAATANRVGVVAVASGDGLISIFRSLGVDAIVTGGQTMNPSTQDLLQAVESLPQDEVIILPNNSNIILAAEQAARLTSKQVHVLRSKSIPQGFAAMVRFSPTDDMPANAEVMQQELHHVSIAEITTAVRDARIGEQAVRVGQVIALLNGELAAAGDALEEVVAAALAQMHMESYEHLTIYYGRDVHEEQARALADRLESWYPEHGVEINAGGQPVYRYILAAE